ncbi:WxL domain-containing protein [Xylocopilactobacillus apis]|uniref:WxL domain-containing protein n=1 Tax=Xylocopilactobacillus apis TaxID=2932183 RepID=A0AAU9DU23_9LACO|nr:WxL domain-containing protein [Xylocopilactobacillus apis]BDR57333.1 hypothetical protein KIMC2_18950 [Xylocopilactobacillus apis]
MNFNKKALLATAGVVAGVLAPAAAVFAADGYDTNGNAGSGITLPVYTSGESNAASGTAKAYSVASVYIKTGFLQLNAVPNFHFMPSFAGGTSNLLDNDKGEYAGTQYIDGVPKPGQPATGLLQVADSRTSGSGTAKAGLNGWKLSLSLGAFQHKQGSGTVPTGWALTVNRSVGAQNAVANNIQNFAPMAGVTNNLPTPTGADTTSPAKTFTSGGSDTDFWTANEHQGVGVTSAMFNTPTSAKLEIPEGVTDGGYYAPLTWTLTAGV